MPIWKEIPSRPNARFWMLLGHGLQLDPGWVKIPLLPLDLSSRDNETDLICEAFESEKCYILDNKGCWARRQMPWKPQREMLRISRFLPIAWHNSVSLGTKNNEGCDILSINQVHLHKAGWPGKVDVYPTTFLNAICHPQAAERIIPS